MELVSYAEAGEDVLLWRALGSRVRPEAGFYIDLDAYDPDAASVTRAFHERGWRGVNGVPDPSRLLRFVERRPGDANVSAPQEGLDGPQGPDGGAGGLAGRTLGRIFQEHVAANQPVHFLRISMERNGGAVLDGFDLRRRRPWIMVVQTGGDAQQDDPAVDALHRRLRRSGYVLAGADLSNRYYVARERAELKRCFALQPDRYERADQVLHRETLEAQVRAMRGELEVLKRFPGKTWAESQPEPPRGPLLFIGCATDRRFVEPTAVMLASVDCNGGAPEAVVVVAGFGLDDADKARLRAGAGRLGPRLSFFDITAAMLHDVEPSRFTDEYPPAVLGKLLIAEYIGDCEGRLVTLDSDMIVNSSLRPLMEMDLHGEFFAAIHDPPRHHEPDYFNSGLTLADLAGLRRHDIGRRCLRYIAEHRPHFPDQDALNAVIGRSWVRLERSWNYFCYGEQDFTLATYEGARVAHFAGPKPWEHPGHPGRPLYERHLARVRRAVADTAILSEPEARDLLASSYEVLLGRELDSLDLVRDRGHLPRAEILKGVMRSAEFVERVLPSCAPDQLPFPDGRFPGRPSLRQRLWAADHLAGDEDARTAMERSASWHDLLTAITRDSPYLEDADRGRPSA